MKKIAVLGAGLAGATAAARLVQAGYQVTVFDKGRVAGGRMSSKRTEDGYLDMGAQYFTVRSDDFKLQVQQWLGAGNVELWSCTTALLCDEDGVSSLNISSDQQNRFVGVPSMQSPVKALLHDIPLLNCCRIVKLEHLQKGWTLSNDNEQNYTEFDAVIVTLPPAQSQQLFAQSALPRLLRGKDDLLEPCWAVAMQAAPVSKGDAIFCQHPKLRFISYQQKKSGRNPCYVLHFNAAFSSEHLHETEEFWFTQAAMILRQELNIQGEIKPLAAHRWLYASQRDQATAPGLISWPEQQLWAGGDWSYGGRVENAYLAGVNLARAVIEYYQQQDSV